MTDGTNQGSDVAFENLIQQFFQKLKSGNMNYFQLFGINTNATHRDIEAAYKQIIAEFSDARIANVNNPVVKGMANTVKEKIQHAYGVLIDYDKRAEYEKRGFKELNPEDLEEDDSVEKAKEIHRKAKTLFAQKDFGRTVRAMMEAVKLDPERSDYYLLLGLAQSHIPELRREAEKNLQKVIEIEPWNAEPWAGLGMIFYQENLMKKAEYYFRKAVSLEADHVLATRKLAEIAPKKKSITESVQDGLGKVLPSIFKKKS